MIYRAKCYWKDVNSNILPFVALHNKRKKLKLQDKPSCGMIKHKLGELLFGWFPDRRSNL